MPISQRLRGGDAAAAAEVGPNFAGLVKVGTQIAAAAEVGPNFAGLVVRCNQLAATSDTFRGFAHLVHVGGPIAAAAVLLEVGRGVRCIAFNWPLVNARAAA